MQASSKAWVDALMDMTISYRHACRERSSLASWWQMFTAKQSINGFTNEGETYNTKPRAYLTSDEK